MDSNGRVRYGKSNSNQKRQPQNQDDPQIPRPDLRFVRKTAPDTERGKSPNTNTHKKRFAKDTAVENHCVLHKNMQT